MQVTESLIPRFSQLAIGFQADTVTFLAELRTHFRKSGSHHRVVPDPLILDPRIRLHLIGELYGRHRSTKKVCHKRAGRMAPAVRGTRSEGRARDLRPVPTIDSSIRTRFRGPILRLARNPGPSSCLGALQAFREFRCSRVLPGKIWPVSKRL